MIRNVSAYSVNTALSVGLFDLINFGIEQESRNGRVLVSPRPVVTTYYRPLNRVLVNNDRDANPFFHLFESLWMLAGRNDVEFVAKFAGNMRSFSDDGNTLWGAYGYRWRNFFGYDQLVEIVGELKRNPTTRRAVLSMWNGMEGVAAAWDPGLDMQSDLGRAIDGGKDVPCNTHAYFDTIDGKLNMTVCCRSNDVIWGAYGANAVHFSFLLEYISVLTGIPMGVYRQFSLNYHIYLDLYPKIVSGKESMEKLARSVEKSDIYMGDNAMGAGLVRVPLLATPEKLGEWDNDLQAFMDLDLHDDYETPFFNNVALPMLRAWSAYKEGDSDAAMNYTQNIWASDWRIAAQNWLTKRRK
tara:strand:+ start:337 stop:1401 length:1065 start_codon:yes stop_codon:yes gene_type:complete